MKRFLKILVIMPVAIHAQVTSGQLNGFLYNISTIPTAVPFLRISPDARASAMGEGSIALCNDANAMHWNVARLSLTHQKFGVGVSYTPWLRALVPDMNLLYAAGYFKPDSVSAVGISCRYFSMGEITYRSAGGAILGKAKPVEYAVDAGYSRKLFHGFSVGIAFRYIYSDLTNGINVGTRPTYPGKSYSGDIGISWLSNSKARGNWKGTLNSGLAITNVGTKMKYNDSSYAEFIPINMGIAQGVVLEYMQKHRLELQLQFDKLLVPSPPIYEIDMATGSPKVVNGQYVILVGKDPNRTVWKGITGSFNDAPGGVIEELQEINISVGAEYFYTNIFAVRCGYFYEHPIKGNRQFVSLGCGIKYNMFALDFSFLIPTSGQRSPMQNTLRFTLMMAWGKLRPKLIPHR